MTDKKEEELTKVSKWEEIVQYFTEDESPAEKNQRQYGRTRIIKGKKEPDIPTSTDIGIIRAVKGTDQRDLYNTMFGHIFKKYRTLV